MSKFATQEKEIKTDAYGCEFGGLQLAAQDVELQRKGRKSEESKRGGPPVADVTLNRPAQTWRKSGAAHLCAPLPSSPPLLSFQSLQLCSVIASHLVVDVTQFLP